MPGRRCAVFGCNNSKMQSKKRGENIIFHNFPKENGMVSSTSRSHWIRRCRRADNFNPDTGYICSQHFTENDYERDLQHELLGLPLRKKLKKSAVPTRHLPGQKTENPEWKKREAPSHNRRQKQEVQNLLATPNTSPSCPEDNILCGPRECILSEAQHISQELRIETEENDGKETLLKKYNQLLAKYENLKKETDSFKKRMNDKHKVLKDKISVLNKKLKEKKAITSSKQASTSTDEGTRYKFRKLKKVN